MLRVARPMLERDATDGLLVPLRRATRAMSQVRDLDSVLNHVRADYAKIDEFESDAGLNQIVDQLRWCRARAHRVLCTELDSDWYDYLLDELDSFTDAPPFNGRGSLAHIALRQHERVRRRVAELSEPAQDTELHRIRKALKRARASAELSVAAGIPGADSYAESASDLQDALGDHHDAVVAIGTLDALSVTTIRADVDQAIDELTNQQRRRQESIRRQLPNLWRSLDQAATPTGVTASRLCGPAR